MSALRSNLPGQVSSGHAKVSNSFSVVSIPEDDAKKLTRLRVVPNILPRDGLPDLVPGDMEKWLKIEHPEMIPIL